MAKKLLLGFIVCTALGLLGGIVLPFVGVSSPGIVGAICGGLGGFIFVRIFLSSPTPKN